MRHHSFIAIAVFFAAMFNLTGSDARAQGAQESSPVELLHEGDNLEPGQWVWAPEISRSGPVTVYVDLSRQLATIYRNGVRIGVSTVSSGRPGHETPTGVFTILQKDADHRSSTYNNAPMPYQERLTWDGVALHAGGLPGYPESHGCIHLPLEFSRLLFGITDMGGTVIVSGEAGTHATIPAYGVLAPQENGLHWFGHQPLDGSGDYRWNPQLSPTGPVSIVVSKADQQVVVLRNGIEIGRAGVHVPADDFTTHLLTFVHRGSGRPHWVFSAIPGHVGETGRNLDAAILHRLRMPEGFYDRLQRLIVPGTTILVTQASVEDHTTGPRLTVMASQSE